MSNKDEGLRESVCRVSIGAVLGFLRLEGEESSRRANEAELGKSVFAVTNFSHG